MEGEVVGASRLSGPQVFRLVQNRVWWKPDWSGRTSAQGVSLDKESNTLLSCRGKCSQAWQIMACLKVPGLASSKNRWDMGCIGCLRQKTSIHCTLQDIGHFKIQPHLFALAILAYPSWGWVTFNKWSEFGLKSGIGYYEPQPCSVCKFYLNAPCTSGDLYILHLLLYSPIFFFSRASSIFH